MKGVSKSRRMGRFGFDLMGFILGFLSAVHFAQAQSPLLVPQQYSTIQAAINAANSTTSQTILVSPGVYNEAINFSGKLAHVISTGGPAVTFIAPPPNGNAFTFSSGETSTSLVAGFTITNAASGIYMPSGSPSIYSNVIVENLHH